MKKKKMKTLEIEEVCRIVTDVNEQIAYLRSSVIGALIKECNTEKAIREGVFFDLTYANLAGWVFNEHKQYAFMRKLDDELLLIMVNFDSIPVRAAVNIPQHAFDFLGIPYNLEYNAVELLTGNTEKLVLSPDKTTPVLLDAMNGKILKFKL